MNQIMEYIINMIPYMLIAVPITIVFRILMYKVKLKQKINWHHEILLLIFILFLVGLVSQTIIPKFEIGINGNIGISHNGIGEVNLIPLKVLIDTYREVFINENINYFIINFLGNIVMFIPIGFCIPLLWQKSNKKVILYGFLISCFIEFCQLFLSRGTDIDDLILNTIGTLIGYVIYKLLRSKLFEKFKITSTCKRNV